MGSGRHEPFAFFMPVAGWITAGNNWNTEQEQCDAQTAKNTALFFITESIRDKMKGTHGKASLSNKKQTRRTSWGSTLEVFYFPAGMPLPWRDTGHH